SPPIAPPTPLVEAPSAPTLPPTAQPTPLVETPSAPLPPVALPTPPITASPEVTGSVQTSQTTASAKARKPLGIRPAQRPASPVEGQSTPIAVVPMQDH